MIFPTERWEANIKSAKKRFVQNFLSKFCIIVLIAEPRGVSWALTRKIAIVSCFISVYEASATCKLSYLWLWNVATSMQTNKLGYIKSKICLLARHPEQDCSKTSHKASHTLPVNLPRPLFAWLAKANKAIVLFSSQEHQQTRDKASPRLVPNKKSQKHFHSRSVTQTRLPHSTKRTLVDP